MIGTIAESNITRQIARLTTTLAYRFQMGNSDERAVINTAISILTQAMVIADTDAPNAQRLYTLAMKIGSMAKHPAKVK